MVRSPFDDHDPRDGADPDDLDAIALTEDYLPPDRRDHRRGAGGRRKPRPSDEVVFASLTDVNGAAFETPTMTYRPARFEEAWLNEALGPFIHAALLTDVLRLVKGGKEANVYLCRAHPNLGVDLVAAKVYRPRRFRNLRNDSLYRQGRVDLAADGKSLVRDKRALRALAKGTAVGTEMRFQSWLAHEAETLQRLADAGCAVPRTFGCQGQTILLGYVGDARTAAPTLSQVRLPRAEAAALFDVVVHNVDAMLAVGVVHGDLSAYNILHWRGAVTLIDFPQAVDPFENPAARRIFDRDVARVCQYFAAQGVAAAADPAALAEAIWARHVAVDVFREPYHGHAAAFGDGDEGEGAGRTRR